MEYLGIKLPEGLKGIGLDLIKLTLDGLKEQGTLHELDTLTFYMLADNIKDFNVCEEIIDTCGYTTSSDRGNVIPSAFMQIKKQLHAQIMDKLKQMGLTSVSRTRLKIEVQQEEQSPLEKILNN